MSDYFVQEETMSILANHARRLTGSSDKLSGAEILEVMSRTQGNVKTSGKYNVKVYSDIDVLAKSNNYDTNDVCAFPEISKILNGKITLSNGNIVDIPIAKFNRWMGTNPIIDNYTVINNMNILVCASYTPRNNNFIIQLKTTSVTDPIKINFPFKKGMDYYIDNNYGGTFNENQSSFSFTSPTIEGYHIIEIDLKDNNIKYNETNLSTDTYTISSIIGLCIPKLIEIETDEASTNMFYKLNKLEYVIFDINVKINASCLFEGCSSLKNIILPNNMTLSKNMFYKIIDDSKITRIVLPYGVTKIPEYCFSYCSKLTDIIVPDSITEIGEGAFSYCASLPDIYDILSVKNITSIPNSCFYGCETLTTLNIPNNITEMHDNCFSGCSGLTNIIFPNNNITKIPYRAFSQCKNLRFFKALDNIKTIEGYSFETGSRYNGQNITVVITGNVTINGPMFGDNSGYLTLILLSDSICVATYGNIANGSYSGISIYVPDNLVDSYKTLSYGWTSYASYIKPLSECTIEY